MSAAPTSSATRHGRFLVLEDNARTPSGVAYVVENRHMTLRVLSDLMAGLHVRGVDEYGLRLHRAMAEIAPAGVSDPQVVLLSPGIFNSAYFEHVFLAREMGVPLVEGRDLLVEDGRVWMRTTAGLAPVHTIYRRLNDDFLDPDAFRPDSQLGVRGLMEAWRRGAVSIANAVGTGVADDKAVYAYMPRIIRYYLGEDAILPNVDTRSCAEPEGLAYTLAHLHELVVKPVAESGGYGLLIGPHASKAELDEFRDRLKANPANYISQPMVKLSVSPTLCDDGVKAAAHRSAAVRGDRARHLGAAGRPDARRAARRLAGGELLAGRRLEGHLGAGMSEAVSASKHLIARHAGSALWLARYMERIENLARLLDVTKTFARDAEGGRNWLSLLRINGDQAAFFAKHADAGGRPASRISICWMPTIRPRCSPRSAMREENARTLRALISTEMWLQINVFHGRIRALSADRHRAGGAVRRLRDAEGRRAVAHRHHRGHLLSRPVLALLHDGPASGARRPDHAADRHQVQCAAADRPRPMPRSTPANGMSCCVPPPAITPIAASIRTATCRVRSPASCC